MKEENEKVKKKKEKETVDEVEGNSYYETKRKKKEMNMMKQWMNKTKKSERIIKINGTRMKKKERKNETITEMERNSE